MHDYNNSDHNSLIILCHASMTRMIPLDVLNQYRNENLSPDLTLTLTVALTVMLQSSLAVMQAAQARRNAMGVNAPATMVRSAAGPDEEAPGGNLALPSPTDQAPQEEKAPIEEQRARNIQRNEARRALPTMSSHAS